MADFLAWPFKARLQPGASCTGDIVLLSVLGLLLFSSGLGLRDPWPADEPRYALVAKEMVESGNWLFPHRGGELYPDKPPLFMWAMATLYALTGSMKTVFLLPSLLAAWATLLLVYDLGRRLWTRRTGLYAGITLLLLLQFPLQAKMAQIDATVTLWTTLGLYGLLRHLILGPAWRWYYLGCAAMGLGVMTKGVGFLPLLALIPYAVGRTRNWAYLCNPQPAGFRWLLGPFLTLAAISLWLIPMVIVVFLSNDPQLHAYRDNILWSQTAMRYATEYGGHSKPFWYFLTNVIPWAWFPLILAFPWLIPAWYRRLKRQDGRYLLLLSWIMLVLLFFSLSDGKRGVYILPTAPAVALAAAALIPGLLRKVSMQRLAWFAALLLAGLFVALALAGGILRLPHAQELTLHTEPWTLVGTLGVVGLFFCLLIPPRQGVSGLAILLVCFWLFFGWWAYPLINPARSSEFFMAQVSTHIGSQAELALLNPREQFILHADRPIVHFGFRAPKEKAVQGAAHWLRSAPNRWIMMAKDSLEPCFKSDQAIALGQRHRTDWYLLDHHALKANCQGQKNVPFYSSQQLRN